MRVDDVASNIRPALHEGAIELGRTIYLNGNLCNLYLGFNCIGHIGVAIISQSLRMGTKMRWGAAC